MSGGRVSGGRGMLAQHLRSSPVVSVLIAILVAATVLVVALAPRALVRLGTEELRFELAEQEGQLLDLSGIGPVGLGTNSGDPGAAEFLDATGRYIDDLPSRLPQPLSDGVGDSDWLLRTKSINAPIDALPLAQWVVKLVIDPVWTDRVRVIDGQLPQAWAAPNSETDPVRPIEIAVSRDAADTMQLAVGDEIETDSVPYEIAAVYDPVDPSDPYWLHARDLIQAVEIRDPLSPLRVQASAYVATQTLVDLREPFSTGELFAWLVVHPEAYDFADLSTLGEQVREVTATPLQLPNSGQLSLRSALDNVFDVTADRVAATSALVALTGSGFLGVLIATYALCIQALVARRRSALSLASARGASSGQLRWVMTLESALIAVPGSVGAVGAAALLLPERVGWVGWLAPAAVALVPVALAFILTAGQADRESGRDDLAVRSPGSARWIVEVAVAGFTALAVFLLQRRGLVESSAVVGIDPLLVATPVLLAAVVGLVVIRLYPLPLAAVHRALRPRTAAASIVGSARSMRAPAIGIVATLALVTGITIVVFTTGMISTVAEGLRQSARDQVGADLQVTAHDLPQSLVDDLQALPEIAAAVSLVIEPGVEFADESSPTEATVVLADTAALHDVRPDIPDISGKVDGRLRILESSDWGARIDGTELRLVNSLATSVGVIDSNALPGVARRWILVDIAAKDELDLAGETPSLVLARISGGTNNIAALDAATAVVTAAQPDQFVSGIRVVEAQSLLDELRESPVVSGLERSLVLAAAAALLLTMLIVILSALTAAASRNRVVGVLRILGMDRAQIRALVAWEFAPVTILAVIVGAALGVALPYLITAVLDLRSFVGGNAVPVASIDPLWIAAAVGIFVVGVVVAAVGATLAGRRFAPAGTLKMGEE